MNKLKRQVRSLAILVLTLLLLQLIPAASAQTMPGQDSAVRIEADATKVYVMYGDANLDGTFEASDYQVDFFLDGEAVMSERRIVGTPIEGRPLMRDSFPPDGWICAPYVNFCTPNVLMPPDADTDHAPPGTPGDCPAGWVRPVGVRFCVPDTITSVAPDPLAPPDGCPEGWVESNLGCVPEVETNYDPQEPFGPGNDGCPAGWVQPVGVRFCIPDQIVALPPQPGGPSVDCADGWVMSQFGCIPEVFTGEPPDISSAPGDCPPGWSWSPGVRFCFPDEFMIATPPDFSVDCPPGWTYAVGVRFCVPDVLVVEPYNPNIPLPPQSSGCPDGWEKPAYINVCMPSQLIAPSLCEQELLPPDVCLQPAWDVLFDQTIMWIAADGSRFEADKIVFTKAPETVAVAAVQIEAEWECVVHLDGTSDCDADVLLTDSCEDRESCPLLIAPIPTAVTVQAEQTTPASALTMTAGIVSILFVLLATLTRQTVPLRRFGT